QRDKTCRRRRCRAAIECAWWIDEDKRGRLVWVSRRVQRRERRAEFRAGHDERSAFAGLREQRIELGGYLLRRKRCIACFAPAEPRAVIAAHARDLPGVRLQPRPPRR